MRTRDVTALLAALKSLSAPDDDQRAELIALAFVHPDDRVRTKATSLYKANFDDLATLKKTFRTIRTMNSVADALLHELGHPLTREIARAMMFHGKIATGTAFDLDPDIRRALLPWYRAFSAENELTELWLQRGMEPYEAPRFHAVSEEMIVDVLEFAREAGLRGVQFQHVFFDKLPAAMAKAAPWMKFLQIAGSKFATLPDVILELEQLEELVLWSHRLEDLPDLSRLRHLKSLDLSWATKMTSVPEAVCSHPGIEVLKIGVGTIKELPASIVHMTSLRVLDIERSKIAKLPKHVTQLPKLETIVIAGCGSLDVAAASALFAQAGRTIAWKT